MDEHKKSNRRRGEVLQEAILRAAWEELGEIGYTHLTMESVATRAGTNKAVLYRRWNNKSELVIDVIRKNLHKFPVEIPNTGDLREDVYFYLCEIAKPIQSLGVQTTRGLMMEPLIWNNTIASIISSIPRIAQSGPENKVTAAIRTILKNAELRGEVRLEKLPPRIVALPWELLRSEMLLRQEVSDTTIAEIVDDIFMPLIQFNKSKRT